MKREAAPSGTKEPLLGDSLRGGCASASPRAPRGDDKPLWLQLCSAIGDLAALILGLIAQVYLFFVLWMALFNGGTVSNTDLLIGVVYLGMRIERKAKK